MKSKAGLRNLGITLVILTLLFSLFIRQQSTVFGVGLTQEWLDSTFPIRIDDPNDPATWVTLPYGYSLGPWPSYFAGEPIVTKLTYQKGPPLKFIQNLTQVWKPGEIELLVEGPKTIASDTGASAWKECFESSFLCVGKKNLFLDYAFPRLKKSNAVTVKWFDNLDLMGARGVHIHINAGTYQIDRFSVISEKGVVQNFSLKYVSSPVGLEAQTLFYKIMGGIKIKDDLTNARAWIQNRISHVDLKKTQAITDPKIRLSQLIQIQNLIFSHLSVDPTRLDPFFHLAGITHLLTMDLLRMKKPMFSGQEAWLLSSKPTIEALIQFAKDFPEHEASTRNMEALLQDILLLQQQIMSGK